MDPVQKDGNLRGVCVLCSSWACSHPLALCRLCDYPQVIGLKLEQGARVTQVQILSHQSKIATKIELFVGLGPSYDECSFTRLGYKSVLVYF